METLTVKSNTNMTIMDTKMAEQVTLLVGENATVRYLSLMMQSGQRSRKAIIEKGGRVEWYSAIIGGNSEQEICSVLRGNGASSIQRGIFLGRQHDQFKMNYWHEHQGQHTTSEILIHGVLFDNAYADFKGNIRIKQSGTDTTASLTEHTILLGNNARSHSIPQLEIGTNAVKANHSSAVTKIDEEQLFYLQSRGLSLPEASYMIVGGFLEEIVNFFTVGEWKNKLLKKIYE